MPRDGLARELMFPPSLHQGSPGQGLAGLEHESPVPVSPAALAPGGTSAVVSLRVQAEAGPSRGFLPFPAGRFPLFCRKLVLSKPPDPEHPAELALDV